jgi:FkbM family methyltransferase
VEFVRAHGLGRPHSAPPTEAVPTKEGFLVHVDPTDYAVGHTISVTGTYEPEVSATVRSLLRPGATFVDAGANIGWFSLLAAGLVGPGGRVVAVEPNPLNCDLARRSAEASGFANIEVFTVALSDRTRTVALETDGSNGRVVPIDGPPPQPVRASFVVAAHPLDLLLNEAGVQHVDVVKLDVEGAEPLVLAGAPEMLARDRPALVSEFYPLALDSSPWGGADAYLAQLRQLGYRLSAIGFGASPDDDQDDATLLSLARDGKGQIDLLATPR